jgi:hypothetical protein
MSEFEKKIGEKAKTLNELISYVRTRKEFATCGFLHEKEAMEKLAKEGLEKWVRFEDVKELEEELKARIEIGKDTAVVLTKLGREIEALKNERGELKQKLQLLWNTIPIDFNLEIGEVTDIGTKKSWREWLEKFEEFMKE